MNMFARFDENPAMTLRVIKETKRYGRTDGRTDGQRENSIPPTNKVCGGYNDWTLLILIDFPCMLIELVSRGLPILYFKWSQVEYPFCIFKGSQVEISKLWCISVLITWFYLHKQCRPWWNAPLWGISSGSLLLAKVPVYQYTDWKGVMQVLIREPFKHYIIMITFLSISLNMCCKCSNEPSQWDHFLSTHNICFGWEIRITRLQLMVHHRKYPLFYFWP